MPPRHGVVQNLFCSCLLASSYPATLAAVAVTCSSSYSSSRLRRRDGCSSCSYYHTTTALLRQRPPRFDENESFGTAVVSCSKVSAVEADTLCQLTTAFDPSQRVVACGAEQRSGVGGKHTRCWKQAKLGWYAFNDCSKRRGSACITPGWSRLSGAGETAVVGLDDVGLGTPRVDPDSGRTEPLKVV